MLPYQQTIANCFQQNNAAEADYNSYLEKASDALATIRQWQAGNTLPLLQLPSAKSDLVEIETVAARYRRKFQHVVVIGTGGSSLGAKTLVDIKRPWFTAAKPQIHFLENVDPSTLSALLSELSLPDTGFLAVSKSGTTAESMSCLTLCIAAAERADLNIADHFTFITEPGDRPLRALGEQYQCPILDHDPKVGGRFSVLSLVGLIPAAIAGVDIMAIRAGAQAVLNTVAGPVDECPPAVGAAVNMALAKHGKTLTVLMPYLDRLESFGQWFRQLWAESLGKDGKGTTPIRSMGTVDQHSQVQLFLDGPDDKFFTVLGLQAATDDIIFPAFQDSRLDYLTGRTLGDLLVAEQRATHDTLVNNGNPVRLITIEELDAFTLGALLMHYMLETIIAAELLGIDAFDQPAVEEGKVLTKQYLAEAKDRTPGSVAAE